MMVRTLSLMCAMLLAQGCFAVTDLDRFQVDDPCLLADLGQRRTLNATIRGFGQAPGNRLEVQLLDVSTSSAPVLLSRGVVAGLDPARESGSFDVRLFNAIPPGGVENLRILIWEDLNGDDMFVFNEDRARQYPIECPSGLVDVTLDDAERDINDPPVTAPAGSVVYTIRGFVDSAPHEDDLFELAVVDESANTVVGYYRVPFITEDEFAVRIPNVVNDGQSYVLEFYADQNNDFSYTVNDDHYWREPEVANANGIEGTFDHVGEFVELTVF